MLSILIPVYNFDVGDLVADLHRQCTKCEIDFEILCYDDASLSGFQNKNRRLGEMKHVIYKEMDENLGRSKIRNLLAEDAQHDQLLFMDCDSKTVNEYYIQNYLEHLGDHLVYGGRAYESSPPDEPMLYLRWYYGTQREMIDFRQRQMKPYMNFMTNNFVIPRQTYLDIRLDETLEGYGHEDTLFGMELKDRNIKIKHIDNPLVHIGLEEAAEFIAKTKEGVRNLYGLIRKGKISPKEVKIYRYYRRLKKLGMNKTVLKSFNKNERKIVKNLNSKTPNLKRFDFFKLGYLLQLDAADSGK